MNPTVTLAIPINLLSEDDTLNAVLAATENQIFLVVGQDESDALADVPGAPRWKMRQLSAPLSGHQTTRIVHVVKSGGRFRLTENNAEGINLAEEAELPFKSLKNFGEIVRRCFNGELEMGETPEVISVSENKGTITVTLPFSSGFLNVEGDVVISANGSELGTATAASSISGLEGILGNIGTVSTDDPGSGTGDVTFTITLTVNTPTLTLGGALSETINRAGYVAPVVGSPASPANAILLDQVAGALRFVRVPSVPSGTDVATCIRPVTPESELAFLE